VPPLHKREPLESPERSPERPVSGSPRALAQRLLRVDRSQPPDHLRDALQRVVQMLQHVGADYRVEGSILKRETPHVRGPQPGVHSSVLQVAARLIQHTIWNDYALDTERHRSLFNEAQAKGSRADATVQYPPTVFQMAQRPVREESPEERAVSPRVAEHPDAAMPPVGAASYIAASSTASSALCALQRLARSRASFPWEPCFLVRGVHLGPGLGSVTYGFHGTKPNLCSCCCRGAWSVAQRSQ
jgi:hypothetical protein